MEETMGTSMDHTGRKQMVEQPEDIRSGPPFNLTFFIYLFSYIASLLYYFI